MIKKNLSGCKKVDDQERSAGIKGVDSRREQSFRGISDG